ncbi:MAG: hypothetical protein MJK18_07310 [Bdellovibrionales bacterium]|nr:hypothetical protein [Bdellovibrionales bacterium]
MEKSFLLSRALPFLFLFIFILPLVHLLFYVRLKPVAWDPFLLKVMGGAVIQASLSTLVTMALAILGSMGMVSVFDRLSTKLNYVLTVAIMLPSFLPPIVNIILGSQAIGHYWTGLWGIVFFHSLMNLGIVGFILAKRTHEQAGGWAQLCRVEDVSFLPFYLKGVLPGLKKDITSLSVFLFIVYFLSFSIPLFVGDVGYSGVEVFIYEKIFLFGQWNEAIQYCLAFILILYAASFFRDENQKRQNFSFHKNQNLWPYRQAWLSLILLLPTLLLSLGFFKSAISWALNLEVHWVALRGTLLTGLITGLFVFLMFSLLTYSSMNQKLSKRL